MKKNFELIFTKESLKRLKHLDRQTQIRILRELKVLEDKPLAGKQLVGRLSELKSFRVGDYRVIYQVSNGQLLFELLVTAKKSTINKQISVLSQRNAK